MGKDDKKKDLDYYMSLQYEVILKKRKRGFALYIPELAIVEEDENLQKAYEKLKSEKNNYFKNYVNALFSITQKGFLKDITGRITFCAIKFHST